MRDLGPRQLKGGRLVLVSDHVDGRSRSAVAAVRALAADGYRPVVTVTGTPSAAARSRHCAGILRTPAVGTPGFRETVEPLLEEGAAIIAASDAVLVALHRPGAALVDKTLLPKRAAAAGLRTPETREFFSTALLLEEAGDLEYPVVVKPAIKTAPTEVARRVEGPAELCAALEPLAGPVVVQPFSQEPMRAVCGVIADDRLVAAVHQRYVRIWPADCGTGCAAVTVEPDRDFEERLPELLEGHVGVFQVQLVGDAIIDINPRVYGSLPLAVAAGANLPAIACRIERGKQPAGIVRGRPGVRYQWLEGDLRRLLHDARAGALTPGAAVRALLPRPGTAHSIESVKDPVPFLIRLAAVARSRRG